MKKATSNIFARRLRVVPQFLKVLHLVARIRLGLSTKGFEKTQRTLFPHVIKVERKSASRAEITRMAKLVVFAARFVPAASCLTQGLALQKLLFSYGLKTNLVLGVKREPSGAFAAHAWLMRGEVLLIGGPQSKIDDYSPINQFES